MAAKKSLLIALQNTWWFAWIVAIVLVLGQAGDAIDGLDKLLVLTKIKPDSLALAETAEKGEFSRSLTEIAWKRMFWARAFCARVKRGAPSAEIDEAYKSYMTGSEAWSSKIMVFIVRTDNYYGETKALELETQVQPALISMAESIATLRYASVADRNLLDDSNAKIDKANRLLYKFVRGFEQRTAN